MALVLLLAFGLQTFSRVVIMIDYVTNQKAYAINCVNKFRPKMNCKGECQMMKKLAQEEKKDQKNPERKLENKNEITLSSKSFYPELAFYAFSPKPIYFQILPDPTVKMPRSIFRPPAALYA